MPTNVFFSPKVRTEQFLFEDIIIESLKMYGQDVFYCPRRIVTRDFILGEDVESKFDAAYTIEAYIENTEGFEGEGNLLSKFGMELRDEATFIMAKRSWEKQIGFYEATLIRPNEGDLIFLPLSNSFFEISFVEHEQPFYQLNNLPVYKLRARLFEYNEEDFDTGFEEIDSIEGAAGYKQIVQVSDVTGAIEVGNTYTQQVLDSVNGRPAVNISAKLVAFNGSLMEFVDLKSSDGRVRNFVTDARLFDVEDTSISALVNVVYDMEENVDQTFANDLAASNYIIEQEADSIIDFSESNPFGEPAIDSAPAVVAPEVFTMDSDNITTDVTTILMSNG